MCHDFKKGVDLWLSDLGWKIIFLLVFFECKRVYDDLVWEFVVFLFRNDDFNVLGEGKLMKGFCCGN